MIASRHSLTVPKLEEYNTKTWGWMGCNDLQTGIAMCISPGTPPIPGSISNTVCGPQVPGTTPSKNGKSLADLNPCPLNACCNVWGQCGTTTEFCTITNSTTGAPGTAAPGTNGCISNCGTDMVLQHSLAPFKKVAYFEAFNRGRDCLTMDITSLDTSKYTHVHFAFAAITQDFHVDVSLVQEQFDLFIGLTGIKRILSFGGWSFSTSQDTYPIFRNSVTPATRDTFIANVVAFVKQYNLDGLDFDWEYPGATDLPGIPAGSPDEGSNYVMFLNYLKQALPTGKSLSIAAPASYWYLKGFPIEVIGFVVDYIIYMTYDLHGQWDYGNRWSNSGCPNGNCLRSHVNMTETINALSMITKAGVPSYKVVVGVTSYGRAFQMTTAGCTDPTCTYTGPQSGASPGECTNTAGYIANAEIAELVTAGGNIKTYVDAGSDSDILVYNNVQWVSYMSEERKQNRTEYYRDLGFGGVADWAVDLESFVEKYPAPTYPDCDGKYASLDDIIADTSIPDSCVNQYVMRTLGLTLKSAINGYDDIMNNGYDDKFNAYQKQVKTMAPLQMQKFYEDNLNDYFHCEYAVYDHDTNTYHNQTGGCPPHNQGDFQGLAYNIYITPKDPETFYKFVESTYGVDRSWIYFKSFRDAFCVAPQDCSAFGSVIGVPDALPDCVVPNPKDIISKALSNLTTLADFLTELAVDASFDLFPGNTADVVDGASLPVFMIQTAVTSMQKVADIGEKAEEEERKNLILTFISALFLILPGVGEALGALADLALLGRIAAMAGNAGNAALSIYDVVQDPQSAPFAICGLLLGGVLGRSDKAFADAAKIRRGMSADIIAALSKDVSTSMGKVAKLVKVCR
jgi:chitinase